MNISIIRYILGSVLKFEAALMLLPCLVAVIYRESYRLFLCHHHFAMSGFRLSAQPPQTIQYSILHEGRISLCVAELDPAEYIRRIAFSYQR